jgi:hypothetical protein
MAALGQMPECREQFPPIASLAGSAEQAFNWQPTRVLSQDRQQAVPAIRHLPHDASLLVSCGVGWLAYPALREQSIRARDEAVQCPHYMG